MGKKLIHAFLLIFTYIFGSAILSYGCSVLFHALHAHWLVPFLIGIGFWITALVLWAMQKNTNVAITIAFLFAILACGFFIAAYIVGKHITLSFGAILIFGSLIPAYYLLLIALLSLKGYNRKAWYVLIAYVVFLLISIFLGAWACRALCAALNVVLPAETNMFFLFFYLLLGFLALGSILPVSDFKELALAVIAPALCATCIVGIIVLCALAGDGDCDCSGCDGGGCDSPADFDATTYKKKKSSSMSKLSDPWL